MRSDYISAWLIKDWLIVHVPAIADAWDFDVDEDVKMVVRGMQKIIPNASIQSMAQNVAARNAIARWNLRDVALLAGGTPTPLSPKASQLLYFTDGNAEAVVEARQAGYPAIKVDVTNLDDLKQLVGAKVAIATGLFHFLPDALAQKMFEDFADAGFETVIFTHANTTSGQEIVDAFARQGIIVYVRDRDDLSKLMSKNWRIADMFPVSQLVRQDPDVGTHLADLQTFFDLYRITLV